MLQPGAAFGRYEIEGLIAEGGMGAVYRAVDSELGRRVAIKIVKPEVLAAGRDLADAKARLKREARAAAALDHPNVVAVFDVGEFDGISFIAMELVTGRSLRSLVGDTSVSMPRRITWLLEMGKALEAAHAAGIVHRDIKPENVTVREDGHVKVLDFGIARPTIGAVNPEGATQTPELRTLTAQGAILGTPLYMAPEQVLGAAVDARTDQFAWGVVAYELLSGRFPWNRDKGMPGLMQSILSEEPAALGDAALPRGMEEAIRRTLRKAPVDRYPSMNEVVSVLEAALASGPPAVGPTKRRRVGVLLAIVSAVGLVGVLGAWAAWRMRTPQAVHAAPASASAAARPTSVTDLPAPASSNPQATTAYVEAMQVFRDGGGATEAFWRATQADPSLAAAHLRYAMLVRWLHTAESREPMQKAARLRLQLSERDQQLLDAALPCLEPEPGQRAECEQRMRSVVDKHPQDAEFWFWLGNLQFDFGNLDEAEWSLKRALAIDPGFQFARASLGLVSAYRGDLDASLRLYEQCLRESPAASDCRMLKATTDEFLGNCQQIEVDARQWVKMNPDHNWGYESLADAMVATGQPREAVLEALKLATAHATEADRVRVRAYDALLDALDGKFDDVVGKCLANEALTATVSSERAHARYATLRIDALFESGRSAEAAAAAEEYLRRRRAWAPDERHRDSALVRDPTIDLAAVRLRAGVLSSAQFSELRDEWVRGWTARLPPLYARYLWIHAWAVPAETAEEARGAIEQLPRYAPLPPYRASSLREGDIGRVYLLAGRIDEAMPFLERGARCCSTFMEPIRQTRDLYWYARGLEAKGARPEACSAYGKVLERWGHARPRSMTGESALERFRKLGCR